MEYIEVTGKSVEEAILMPALSLVFQVISLIMKL